MHTTEGRTPVQNALPAPAPVLGFLLVHAALRREAAELARAAAAGADVAGRVDLVERVIRAHHHGEDRVLLPMLTALDPSVRETATLVEMQHVALDRTIDALRAVVAAEPARTEVVAAVHAFVGVLQAHLELEETCLLPRWIACLGPEDHERFARRLRRATPLRDVALMIPWLVDAAPEPLRAQAEAELPPPLRLAHRAYLRRRFERRWRAAGRTVGRRAAHSPAPAAA